MLTEFDYYQHTGRQRKTGLGWLKREGAGGGFFAGASNQISLMKWGYGIKPTGSETTGIVPYVS